MQNLTPNTESTLVSVFIAEIGGFPQLAVDARELHKFLGVKRDFSSWIKKRITDYGLKEDQDFISILQMQDGYKTDKNGRVIDKKGRVVPVEYTLTLEMAKHLAMVEKNAQGRVVRQYFIDCENQLHAQASAAQPQLPPLSAPETGNDSSRLPEMASIVLLIQERSLFLTLLDCGALGDPALSAAGLQARWRVSRSYFDKLSEDMYEAMYEAVEPNEGDPGEKMQAAFQFIRQWRPRPVHGFPEFSKRKD